MQRRFLYPIIALLCVLVTGTFGYWTLAKGSATLLDALYMTVITVSTIGYGEVIDLGHDAAGRIFTMGIALSGIGVLSYLLTNFTAFIVEGDLKHSFWRKKMEHLADRLNGHFIICGIGNVGHHILEELKATGHPFCLIDSDEERLRNLHDLTATTPLIVGDAQENDTLLRAGIERAKGVFIALGEDHKNLIVCLTARQLNASIKIVSECRNLKNKEKMLHAGASSIVSPTKIGGLRMASVMIRPTVVSFLDRMIRQESTVYRIEEVTLPPAFITTELGRLKLGSIGELMLLAVDSGGVSTFNPKNDHPLQGGDTLIVMATPGGRAALNELLTP